MLRYVQDGADTRLHYDLFFFKQKTAYELRISDWSSDVCSSDLLTPLRGGDLHMNRRDFIKTVAAGSAATLAAEKQIGRASCRERVCQYVSISVVAGSLKKKKNYSQTIKLTSTTHRQLNPIRYQQTDGK